jgi:UDP-glucose 4-epimerase
VKKKVLVTGGLGYIGAHTVVELHEAGYVPVIIDNLSNTRIEVLDCLEKITGERFGFFQSDCVDSEAIDVVLNQHPDLFAVIHFAAFKSVGESVLKPLKYYQNNIAGTQVLIEKMAEKGIHRLVFSSSCTVYGQPDRLPVTEESPLLPANSPYGYTKQVCERMISDTAFSNPELRAVTLRYFNPIGAHPSGLIGELPLGTPDNLVPFITQTAAGMRPELRVFGNDYQTADGTCVRDYIHVVDLARAHVLALGFSDGDIPKGVSIFNLGSETGHSVLDVIRTFEAVNSLKLNFKFSDRRPGDVEKIYSSCQKAKEVLGWKPMHTLSDALKHAWIWETNSPTKVSSI